MMSNTRVARGDFSVRPKLARRPRSLDDVTSTVLGKMRHRKMENMPFLIKGDTLARNRALSSSLVEMLAKEEYFASWARRLLHSDSNLRAVAEKNLSQTRRLEEVRSEKSMFTPKENNSLNAAWITGDIWPPALGSKVVDGS
jgi:hypothetical protein